MLVNNAIILEGFLLSSNLSLAFDMVTEVNVTLVNRNYSLRLESVSPRLFEAELLPG